MFLSNASIKRPIAMFALIVVLLLAGANSYRKIGLDNMPEIKIPYITITTYYPGADPTEIEVDVAKKIEDAVSNIDGLKYANSTCMDGVCVTTLEFNLSKDVDIVAVDVRENIDLIKNEFPSGVEEPEIKKLDINAKPVVTLLLTGNVPVDKLYDYADERLADRLSVVQGVANVTVSGGEELEINIALNKKKLSAIGLNSADIVNKLALDNVKIPSGNIKTDKKEINVTFDGEFKNIESIKNFEVGKYKGQMVRLGDIAEVKMISDEKRTLAYYNGIPAVNIQVVKKGEANAVRVVERIRDIAKEINSSNMLPGGMKLIWFTDDAEFIQASVDDAWLSVVLGVILTGLILFLFLHELRSTFIIIVTMPASIIITFAIMYFFGFTFNNSTLLAIGTSVGVLVTNSIVVIENIVKKLHKGKNPKDSAGEGTGEVAIPVFASATTNIVVFVPIALMSSIVGKYFIPFAITITAATVVSLFISFTLTPMLASIFLKKKMPAQSWLMKNYIKHWNILYSALEKFYLVSLKKLTKFAWGVFIIVIALLIVSVVVIAPKVGMSFFPDNDRGEFIVKMEYPSYYNIDANQKRTMELEKKIRKLPNVVATSTVIGKTQGTIGKVSQGVHLAEITVKTTDKNSRETDMQEMREMFRQVFKNETDCIAIVSVPSVAGGANTDVEFEILGADLDVLENMGREVTSKVQNSFLFRDVDNNIRAAKPQIKIIPNRRVVNDMNLSSAVLGKMLRGNIKGIEVGSYKVGDRSYDIRVQTEEEKGLDQLKEYTFLSRDGKPLGIETVTSFEKDSVPIQIARESKNRIAKIYANMAPGEALGDGIKYIEGVAKQILKPGYTTKFMGVAEKMQEAQADFLEAIIIAAVLTYLLIAAILESWLQPFMILLTLPLALIGLFFALYFAGEPLSMMGLLGAVMLIGIVVNNAILIMDNVIMLKNKGVNAKEAMLRSAKDKFRPILMTSIAAVLGILPMAFSSGLGSEIRSSCGIAVIGGLISSTVLSLYLIPIIYIKFFTKKKKRVK